METPARKPLETEEGGEKDSCGTFSMSKDAVIDCSAGIFLPAISAWSSSSMLRTQRNKQLVPLENRTECFLDKIRQDVLMRA